MPNQESPVNQTAHPLVRIKKIYNEATVTPNPTPPYDSTLLLTPPPPPKPNPDQPLGATAASLARPIEALSPLLKIERVPVPSSDPDPTKHDRLQVVYSFSANIVTQKQLRSPDNTPPTQNNPTSKPNPWEVGWLLWCFSPDPTHPYDPSPTSNSNFRFYALCLKPNGWEVSKQDPSYKGGQRFLKSNTQEDPRRFPPHNTLSDAINPYSVLIKACHEYPLGTTIAQLEDDIIPAHRNSEEGNKTRLTPSRNVFHIFVESALLTAVEDLEKPLPPHIPAFYAEDAHVRFTSMWHATPKRPIRQTQPADYDPLSLHATGYPPQGVVWF
jgi:putative lipoprotein